MKIPHITDFFTQYGGINKRLPWHIIGKGPTFHKWVAQIPTHQFITINEAALYVPADIHFFIDWECFKNCRQLPPGRTIFLPWHPHVKQGPSIDELPQFLSEYELKTFKFYSFDLSTVYHMNDSPLERKLKTGYHDHDSFHAGSNSSEAIFHMLARMGVTQISSSGVDGGFEYHELFKTDKKPVSTNPNQKQFDTFDRLIQQYGVSYQKL